MLTLLKEDKLYYSIGEISDMFGVSKSLIRYWETEFSILKPHKTVSYTHLDVYKRQRQVDLEYASAGQITAFSDGYPILILGQESMNNLNDKLATSVSINRFRPNIVFTGGLPHVEDKFKKIRINNVEMCIRDR